MGETSREELIAIHSLLFQELQTAQQQNDDEKIIICGKKYLRFLAAHHQQFGISETEVKELAQYIANYEKSHKADTEAQRVLEDSTQQMIKSGREFGENLWHHMRRLNSAPPHIKLTPEYNKDYRVLTDFWKEYEKGLDFFRIEHLIDHLQIRLDFYKQMLANKDEFALPKKKLDLLETALNELRTTYEAESGNQEEGSLTNYEAKRVRELFNKIDRSPSATVIRGGH